MGLWPAHEGQQFLGALAGLLAVRSRDEGGYHHVLQGGELGQQLVELEHEPNLFVAELGQFALFHGAHIGAVYLYGTCIGAVQRAHNLQQGGLACAAGTHNAHDLTGLDVQVDAAKYLQVVETLGDSSQLDHSGSD